MLTKNDLQQIRGILKEEVGAVKEAVKTVKEEVTSLKSSIEYIDRKLDKAQEDISEILTEVIGRHDALEQRVSQIEERIALHKPQ